MTDKTYTCGHCSKVGNDFSTMAQELCPKNTPGSGHQIPMLGDRT